MMNTYEKTNEVGLNATDFLGTYLGKEDINGETEVTIVDVWAEDSRSGIEEHHHPGTHGLPHNHLICIQQSANGLALDADPPSAPPIQTVGFSDEFPDADSPTLPCLIRSPRPRSPPLA